MKVALRGCWLFLLLAILLSCQSKTKESDPKINEKTEVLPADTIVIEGMQFKPDKLEVVKGQRVIWINNDFVEHDVTDENDDKKTSGNIEIGKSFELKIDQGFSYKCSIHPTMKGEILMKD